MDKTPVWRKNEEKVKRASEERKIILNPNTGEKILFRTSNSAGYKGYDTMTKIMGKGNNPSILFK
ncbi:hypothetical protein [Pedobacter alpinus]|uniref:NUMOD4 domain-containing protein n=1 Tax=Pedobacter alpinus TaxID=1590643 RepID=A0ABW5TUK0_9SPHI